MCDEAGDGRKEEGAGQADEREFPAHDSNFHWQARRRPQGPGGNEGDHRAYAGAGPQEAGGQWQADVRPSRCQRPGDGADEYSLDAGFGAHPFRYEFPRQENLNHAGNDKRENQQRQYLDGRMQGGFEAGNVLAPAPLVSHEQKNERNRPHYYCRE